jgi:hypothetical protein
MQRQKTVPDTFMSARVRRYALVGLSLFLAANAVAGALWVVPGMPREWLAGTPFPDYTIPALALGVVVGLGALIAGVLLLLRPRAGILAAGLVGAGMMIFELVEVSVIGGDMWLHVLGLAPITKGLPATDTTRIPAPLGIPLPLWQQPVFFLIGAAIFALALALWRTGPRPDRSARPGPVGEGGTSAFLMFGEDGDPSARASAVRRGDGAAGR